MARQRAPEVGAVDTDDKSDSRSGRRTQAERSAAMRLRLLEATVDCLVTYGYGGTTTHRVAELAGVTRGAQIHHFPAKMDLVVAAIEHLAQQRAQAAIREVGRIRGSQDLAGAVLDFLWEVHQGPFVVATLELWVASRTDRVLAHQIERVEPVVNGALFAAIEQVLPDRSAQKELRYAVYTAMDALRGILVAGFVDGDADRLHERWARASSLLHQDFRDALAGGGRHPRA
jgi:AcrR family transcriptional regulator